MIMKAPKQAEIGSICSSVAMGVTRRNPKMVLKLKPITLEFTRRYGPQKGKLPGLLAQSVLLWHGVRLKMSRAAKWHSQINLLPQMIQIKDAPLYAIPLRTTPG